jgi:signal transduction histidine kinase
MLGLSQNGEAEKVKKQLDEISLTASQAIEEVREISYNLRPYHLDELGLTKAIESMCERVAQASQIAFAYRIENLDGFFPKAEEINFYRIVQECVNNIVKHSGATEAEILVKRNSQTLQLEIRDNGKGFDTNLMTLRRASQSGFGLAGINERAKILGGKLVINSKIGEGTTVKLTFV